MAKLIKSLCLLILSLSMLSTMAEVQTLECEVIEEIKRAKRGYTQGFFIKNGKLYESTGGLGTSQLRRFDLATQELEHLEKLPHDFFGEGLTPLGDDRVIQLTWRKGLGIVYNQQSLKFEKIFRYKTEGWGITAEGDQLVMSDGSAQLYYLDPETYQVTKEITVTKDGQEVPKLNELEWVDGSIYANVWMTDEIVQIDPSSGKVTASIDCSHLLQGKRPHNDDAVLNGIAYDVQEKVFYLTGKTWQSMYKVKFTESASPPAER